MREAQGARVEHEARRFDLLAAIVADVHAFAHQRMAKLGEVNADLVLASGLKAALDERRAAKRLHRLDVGYRKAGVGRRVTLRAAKMAERTAQPVAAIEDELGVDA